MRRLIVVTALLASVSSASAIGVGISAHYDVIGLPLGDFGTDYKVSYVGFHGDFEVAVHPLINVIGAFGYQQFKPGPALAGTVNKFTIMPILFGVEYNGVFNRIWFYPGGGMSYNLMKTDNISLPDTTDKKLGIWFGANFYYNVSGNIGVGSGVIYHLIFTDVSNTSWIQIPFGLKWWI